MLYKYTDQNIASLLQSVGTLQKNQLKRFFSAELQPVRVEFLLNEMAIEHRIVYDKDSDTFSCVGNYNNVNKEVLDRRILAFWPIANMGSKTVNEIMTIRYPSQYLVIAADCTTYDFTVIETEMEARVAARVLSESMRPNVEDDINHIAILRHPSDGERLKSALIETGFDFYCTVDNVTHRPNYVGFEAE